jgi:mycothiol synthase
MEDRSVSSVKLPAPRPYRDGRDLARMCDLLEIGRAAANGTYYVHSGDLLWWLHYPPLGQSPWQGIHLWDDLGTPGGLLAWVLVACDGQAYDVYVAPALRGTALADAICQWAEDEAVRQATIAGRKHVSVFWITPDDAWRVERLARRGFRLMGHHVALRASLVEPTPVPGLPDGFEVRGCRSTAELCERARAQYGAFGSSAPFDSYLDRFKMFVASPAYGKATDTVAVAPDGRIAAFCITWPDRRNLVGLLEPVGTHPDFRRLGLGRAVTLRGMGALRDLGMREAIVCSSETNAAALRLYASVGFRQYDVFQYFEREIAVARQSRHPRRAEANAP